jgi:hypothetical protein
MSVGWILQRVLNPRTGGWAVNYDACGILDTESDQDIKGVKNFVVPPTGLPPVAVPNVIVLASFVDAGFPVKNVPLLTPGVPYLLFVDNESAGAAYTVNLPADPDIGCMVTVKKIGATQVFAITIHGNTDTIDGLATFVLDTALQSVLMVYTGAEWSVVA